MPYVKPERRQSLDRVVNVMEEEGIVANGDLNYVLYAYFKRNFDMSYNVVKNYCGELNECACEIRRRLTAPYEDKKIQENGDVD